MESPRVTSNYPDSGRLKPGHEGGQDATLVLDYRPQHDHYEMLSDKEILKAIRNALLSDSSINEDHILVNVDCGWVYLEGKVPTEDQRNLAMKLATDIFGVTRVTNYLTFPRAHFHAH